MTQEESLLRRRLKAPKAAAIAGIVFSVLLIISLVLLLIAVPANPREGERGFPPAEILFSWRSTWYLSQALLSSGSSVWCAIAWGHCGIVSSAYSTRLRPVISRKMER
jgi:hypothetical protein